MFELNRLQRLKNIALWITKNLEITDKNFDDDYVSSSGLTKLDIQDKIDKIKSCASIVELSLVDTVSKKILSVVNANFCKQHSICPVCADRSQSRRRARFDDHIKKQARLVQDKKRYAYMVTFTVKDGDSLRERINALQTAKRSWRKMGQRRKGERSRGESGKVSAGLSTIEIKRGDTSNLWHVHSHDLFFTKSPLDYQVYDQSKKAELSKKYRGKIPKNILKDIAINKAFFDGEEKAVSKISMEWLIASGNESIGVDVSPIVHVPRNISRKKQRKLEGMTFERSVAYQAREVLKYCYKPSNNKIEDMLQIITDTHNRRMVSTYGEFRGISGDDYITDPELDSEKIENFIATWNSEINEYNIPVSGHITEYAKEELETRKISAQLLGEYRRKRRMLFNSQLPSLSERLNMLKAGYKNSISQIWQSYRNRVRRELAILDCDKYNPIVSMQNLFLHLSSKDLYSQAFA